MPITKELDNINELENAGFNHEQSKTLAKIIEQSHTDSHESLKEFIHNEINGVNREINVLRDEFNIKFEKVNSDNDIKFEKLISEINIKFEKVDNKFEKVDNKFEKILNVTNNIDTHIKAGQYDLLIKIFAIVTGTAGMLFAMLKLFG